jgi:hypothetical protein
MFAHDVGRPENRVGDPAREENPPRSAHGGIMSRGFGGRGEWEFGEMLVE